MNRRHDSRDAATPFAILAAGGRDAALLGMVFQRFLAESFTPASASGAAIAIIDRDAAEGASALADWQARHPRSPALLLTLAPGEASPFVAYVRKPINVESLVRTLKQLRRDLLAPPPRSAAAPAQPATAAGREMPAPRRAASPPAKPVGMQRPASRPSADHGGTVSLVGHDAPVLEGRDYCGSADDLPATGIRPFDQLRPHQAISLYFDPDARLLGLLRSARELVRRGGQAASIRGLERPLVVVPGSPMKVISPVRDDYLRPLCSTTLFSETIETGPAPAAGPDDFDCDCDALLWKVTLWAARGRLPRHTDPHGPVRLCQPPDFTRFAATPYAEDICRLWMQERSLSPAATAARLQIPQRYVFALYSAVHLLGLTEGPSVGESHRGPAGVPDRGQHSPGTPRNVFSGTI